MKRLEELKLRLKKFRDDHEKWDTEEFTQSEMVDELDEIIKEVESLI